MTQVDYRNLAIHATAFGLFSVAWMYLFSQLGIGLSTATDLGYARSLLTQQRIINVVLMALFFGAASVTLVRRAHVNTMYEKSLTPLIGGAIAYYPGMLFFGATLQYNMIYASYLIGAALTSAMIKPDIKGFGSKLKAGYLAPKKLILVLALGTALTTFVVVNQDIDFYENQIKQNLLSSLESFDIGSLASQIGSNDALLRATVEQQLQQYSDMEFVESQLPAIESNESMQTRVLAQFQAQAGWNTLSPQQQQEYVLQGLEDVYNKTIAARENAIQEAMGLSRLEGSAKEEKIEELIELAKKAGPQLGQLQGSLGEGQLQGVLENVFETMPLFKMIIQYLPIINAFANFSAVIFVGNIMISPLSSAFGFLIIPKQGFQKTQQQTQEEEMRQAAEHATKMKKLQG
ncbi:MAG: hypothetical protein J4432_01210 [DPANN group archaeon]|nr:hypothetical protein [DPANN group archaeon]